MLFSSSIFIFGFLPICLAVYYLLPRTHIQVRNSFLLFTSIIFYAWGEPLYVFIMLSSIIINYLLALLIENYRKKLFLIIGISINLVILFIFKYLDFSITNINNLVHCSFAIPDITLPIGISFFTFQAISYLIDVYRQIDYDGDQIKAQHSLINVGLYISFFPQLIAGPIVRYKTIAYEIIHRKENTQDFSEGIKLFIIGLGKKVLIANNVALIADKAFSLTTRSVAFSWLGAISYSFQILYDFSGYSDMAIGLGKMFGFHFMQNFNYPYISQSVSEFWRRWHISLGSWFRDYVYFPLGGSKCSVRRTIFNLLIVWSLTGIWHGANWTYILWGLYFFIFITLEKIWYRKKQRISEKSTSPVKYYLASIIKHIYTLLIIILGWIIFRAASVRDAIHYMSNLLYIGNTAWIDDITVLYVKENIYFLGAAILFCMPIKDYIYRWLHHCKQYIKSSIITVCLNRIYAVLNPLIYSVIFLVALAHVVKGTYNPFIYFNF